MQRANKSHYRFAILAIIVVMGVSSGLINMAVAPLFPVIMEQYQVNRATVSLLTSIVTMVGIPFNLTAGILVAKMGLKRAFLVTAILMCAGILTLLATNFFLLLTTRILFGAAIGLLAPVSAALIMQWFSDRELPLANGCLFVSASIGVTTTLFITVPLADAFGWKTLLTALGVVPLLIGFVWLFVGREAGTKAEIGGQSTTHTASSIRLLEVFKYKTTFLLALAFLGPISLWLATSSWLPTYYHEVFRMPMAQASSILGLLNFVGMGATILGTLLPAKVGLRRPFFIIPGFVIILAGFGSFLIDNLVIIYISTMVLGACVWVYLPSLLTLPMELPGMNPGLVAMALGVAFAVGHVFAFTAPIAVGYLRDVTGSYLPGFSLWSVISLSLAISGFLLPETGPKANKATS